MRSRKAQDLNGDGKIDAREQAAADMARNAIADSQEDDGKDSKPKLPPFKNADSARKAKETIGRDNTCINTAGVSEKYLNMFEHDPDEEIVAEIKKHPIGLIGIWFITFLVVIAIWGSVAFVSTFKNRLTTDGTVNGNDLSTAAIAIAVCLTALTLVLGYISAFLYVNNRIIVTSEKIVQIRYFTLFSRKVSSLSIGDVQDVTARQNGILETIFNFGKISIETAGEQDNYEFPLAVDADKNAKVIVQCHEENLHLYGN